MITLMVVVCRNLTARGRGACNIAPTCINWGTHLESLCTTVHALNVHPMCTQCAPNVHQVGERENGGLPWSHCAPLCKNWGPTSQCWIHPPSVVAGLRLHWGMCTWALCGNLLGSLNFFLASTCFSILAPCGKTLWSQDFLCSLGFLLGKCRICTGRKSKTCSDVVREIFSGG